MSLTIAVAAEDRIVVLADSKVYDTDTEEISLDSPKIFKLAKNCAGLVTGEGLGDVDSFMASLEGHLAKHKVSNVKTVAANVEKLASTKTWLGDGDHKDAHLEILIAGYNRGIPDVYVLLSTGRSEKSIFKRYYSGSLKATDYYLYDYFEERNYQKIGYSEAEQAAMRIMLEGEKIHPEDIGGKGSLWHIFPDSISKKDEAYITNLRGANTESHVQANP
jgi:20S proteasome alpha/beta subunit